MEKNKPKALLLKTAGLGLMSGPLYGALLLKQDFITENFTAPGLTGALCIIGTAFLFSLVHGAFTGNFWTVIGIEASKINSKNRFK